MEPVFFTIAVATVFFAWVGLRTPRLHFGGAAIALMGAGVSALFFLLGYPGLGIAAIAASWGVAAAGQVVASVVLRAERRETRPREPWVVALFATGTLVGALTLVIAAVDWSAAPAAVVLPVPIETVELAGWALSLLAVAAAIALATLAPKRETN